jgi:uncharacterized protein (TIGR02145 family)
MAENLNYAAPGSKCGDSDGYLKDANTATCDAYGRLYNWATAMNIDASYNSALYGTVSCGTNCYNPAVTPHRGVCPDGWHLPSDAEWQTLVDYAGDSSEAGTKLKKATDWDSYFGIPKGTDDFEFAALPGGYRKLDNLFYESIGKGSYWWSASESANSFAYNRYIFYNSESAYQDTKDKVYGFSVRCVQN